MKFRNFQLPFILVAAMLVVFVIEAILPGNLIWLGIQPRSVTGLIGIPLAPFIHADLSHLTANVIPLFCMGVMINVLEPNRFIETTVILLIGSGLLTWLISHSGIVIGASGLVFAFLGYLIVYGLRARAFKALLMAIATILIYGSLLFSLFQHTQGVSWAGHFSGTLVGVLVAWRVADKR